MGGVPDLIRQYARAREDQADAIFDECLHIADQYEQAAEQLAGTDHINRARLRIDTRKWMAGSSDPRNTARSLTWKFQVTRKTRLQLLNASSLTRKLRIDTARAFVPLLEPARYKGAFGGRGSGKSHFFAERLIEDALRWPGVAGEGQRALCFREIQKSLKESAKFLIENKLHTFGLSERDGFRVFTDRIQTPGDGLIAFAGMQDHTADSIKSYEGFHKAWGAAIWIAQSVGQKLLVLDYYEAVGQPLDAHVNWLRATGYDGTQCVLPHDGGNSTWAGRMSDALEEAGFPSYVVKKSGHWGSTATYRSCAPTIRQYLVC